MNASASSASNSAASEPIALASADGGAAASSSALTTSDGEISDGARSEQAPAAPPPAGSTAGSAAGSAAASGAAASAASAASAYLASWANAVATSAHNRGLSGCSWTASRKAALAAPELPVEFGGGFRKPRRRFAAALEEQDRDPVERSLPQAAVVNGDLHCRFSFCYRRVAALDGVFA